MENDYRRSPKSGSNYLFSESAINFDTTREGKANINSENEHVAKEHKPNVRFAEHPLATNDLETPSLSRKTPFRRTPAPIKIRAENLSLQECQQVKDGSIVEDQSFHSSIGSSEVRFSSCSPRNKERGSSSPPKLSDDERRQVISSTSDSPLSNLICRPEISKSSPMLLIINKPTMVDVGTSYSPFEMVEGSAQTSFNFPREIVVSSATSRNSAAISTDQNDKRAGMFVHPSSPLRVKYSAVNEEDTQRQYTNSTFSDGSNPLNLMKEGGVSFGRGPLIPSILHNVASLKQAVHHVAAAHPVEAVSVLPQINQHPNQFSTHPKEDIVESPVELPPRQGEIIRSNHELQAIQPALQWVPAKITRKGCPASVELTYPKETNHPNLHFLPSSTETSNSREVKSSEYNPAVTAANVNVGVQVEFESTSVSEKTSLESSGNEADRSHTLEELIYNDEDNCDYGAHSISRQSRKDPLDFTECNIGGTPSTINASSSVSASRSSIERKNSRMSAATPSSAFASADSFSPTFLSCNLSDRSKLSVLPPKPASRLGRARRLPTAAERQAEDCSSKTWSDDESTNAYSLSSDSERLASDLQSRQLIGFEHSHDGKIADITVLTDVAVATFTRDQCSIDCDNESELFSHASTSLETTMTLDKSHMFQRNSSPSLKSPYPRLAIKSLKRDLGNPFDVKEIGFETAPNELMTIMLSFKNNHKRRKSIPLIAKTIFLRVEPLYQQRSQPGFCPSTNDNDSVFSVSPEDLLIAREEEGMLFITFAPTTEGIYSGALKIKYQRKSFTLLLRGECNHAFRQQQQIEGGNINVEVSPPMKITNGENPPHSIFKSTPETLQSFPQTEIGGITSTPSLLEGSPRVFQKKLSELQRKIGEISQKIAIKDSNATSLSIISAAHNHSTTISLPPRPPKEQTKTNTDQVYTFPTSSIITGSATSKDRASPSLGNSTHYLADTEKSPLNDHVQGKLDFNHSSSHAIASRDEQSMEMRVSTQVSSNEHQCAISQHQVTLEQQKITTHNSNIVESKIHSHRQHEQSLTPFDQEDYILNSTRKKGLFFRKSIERFGYTMIGSLVRTKILMCNASHHEMTIYLGDLQPPFYCHHNQLVMKPKSFLRLPVRFIPTLPGEYVQELIAQSEDGKNQAMVQLVGIAASATPYKQ